MKKFKEFKSEQQVISEVGPIGAMMMGAMGLWGAWKTFKKVKETVKGYKESKAEKKENFKNGITIRIKKFNPETGKDEDTTIDIPPGDKRAKADGDGILKLEKEEQKKQTQKNKEAASAWKKEAKKLGMNDKEYVDHLAKDKKSAARKTAGETPNPAGKELKYKVFDRESGKLIDKTETSSKEMFDDEINDYIQTKNDIAKKQLDDYKKAQGGEDEPTANTAAPETGDDETGEDEPVTDPKQATQIYVDKGRAPDGWEWQRDDEGGKVPNFDNKNKKGQILTNKDAEAFREKKRQEKERERAQNKKPTKGMSSQDRMKSKQDAQKKKQDSGPKVSGKDTSAADKMLRRNDRVLKFGEFITEDVMKDLKLASKSKKDSEITLDDGTDIPMDAFTAEILVKYIEGLSSSEKNRVIKQIQRTERAFMKVLGKAHEG